MFSPDSSKGTRGPDGFAVIVDGKYDSTSTTSKGCVAGAQIVSIIGGDGVNKRPRHAYGKLLFDTHRTTTTIPQEGGKIDFVIPDDVKPAPAKSDDAE